MLKGFKTSLCVVHIANVAVFDITQLTGYINNFTNVMNLIYLIWSQSNLIFSKFWGVT